MNMQTLKGPVAPEEGRTAGLLNSMEFAVTSALEGIMQDADLARGGKPFRINEIFYTLQGEGGRAGHPSVFLRFAKCNLKCNKADHGFDCDTEFNSWKPYTTHELLLACWRLWPAIEGEKWIVATGGEPGLQLSEALVAAFNEIGFRVAVETNGMFPIPRNVDWVCVSPKAPATTMQAWECGGADGGRREKVNELKFIVQPDIFPPYVEFRDAGCLAYAYLLSPAWDVTAESLSDKQARVGGMDRAAVDWAVGLVQAYPDIFRLSLQTHKIIGVR